MLERGAELSRCNHMLILAQQMLRWLIPHLPIQASILAAKSKPVVVYTLDMDLVLMLNSRNRRVPINWICVVVYVFFFLQAHRVQGLRLLN
jgi:hypothetical protein